MHKGISWLEKYNLLIFDSLDSTNNEAKRLLKSGATGNFVIWAKEQTAGRGQQDRQWVSEAGNLYFSVIMRPNCPVSFMSHFPFIAGLACHAAVGKFLSKYDSKKNLKLKWPNDILYNDAKMGGILIEAELDSKYEMVKELVIGIGINISSHPQNTAYPTTCLHNHISSKQEKAWFGSESKESNSYELKYAMASNKNNGYVPKEIEINRNVEPQFGNQAKMALEKIQIPTEETILPADVLDQVMTNFERYLLKWQVDGFLPIRKLWVARSHNRNEVITVVNHTHRVSGRFKDIDLTGAIRLKLASGQIVKISTGEVFL